MYIDSELVLSGTKALGVWTGQRICDGGATEASTDYVDQGAAGDGIAPGSRLIVIATEIFAGAGTTLTIVVQHDSDSAFGTATTLMASAAIAKAATVAGTVLMDAVIPPNAKRYIRILYTGDNTFATTGKAVAFIVLDTDKLLDRGL